MVAFPLAATVTIAPFSLNAAVCAPATAPATATPPTQSQPNQNATPVLTSPEDAECPWCTEMAKGPCASEFIAWRNCSRAIKEEDAAAAAAPPESHPPRHVTGCMDLFLLMNVCVKTPGPKRDYYRRILPIDDDYQPTKEEMEKDLDTDDI